MWIYRHTCQREAPKSRPATPAHNDEKDRQVCRSAKEDLGLGAATKNAVAFNEPKPWYDNSDQVKNSLKLKIVV